MDDLVIQSLLLIVWLIAVAIISRTPHTGFSSQWVLVAVAGVVMINTFYDAIYQYGVRRELRRLNCLLSGREEIRPGLRSIIQWFLSVTRDA